MNTELFKQIDDIIAPAGQIDYSRFGMGTWESCGTTRCLAGWAIYLTTGQPLWNRDGIRQSDATLALAREHGAKMYSDGEADFETLAGKLLGLAPQERALFYLENDLAAEFAHLAAQGRHDDARRALRRALDL